MKLTTDLHLVPVLRIHGAIPPVTLYFNGVVLNLKVIYPYCVDSIKNGVKMFCLRVTLFLMFPLFVVHGQGGDGH